MDLNNELSGIASKIKSAIVILLLLLIAASAAYYRSFAFAPFAFGALLGAGLNVVKIAMLERTVVKAVGMEKNDAGNYAHLQYFLRLLITALVLILSAILPFISIWGAVAGIFTMQPAMFYAKYSAGRKKTRTVSNG